MQGEMLAFDSASESSSRPKPHRTTTGSIDESRATEPATASDATGQQVSQANPRRRAPKPPPPGRRLRLSLEQAIQIALDHNLSIQTSRLTRDALLPALRQAEAAFHPTIAFNTSRTDTKTSTTGSNSTNNQKRIVGASLSQPLPTGGSVVLSGTIERNDPDGDNDRTDDTTGDREHKSTATLSVVQPLLRSGRTYVARQGVNNAEFDLRIANANLRSQILTITSLIKTNYYNMILAIDRIRVTQDAIDRSRGLIQASQALLDAKLTTIRDVLSARIQLNQDAASLVSDKSRLDTARNTILNTLGYPIGTRLDLSDTKIGFKPVELDLDELIDRALKNRPELLRLDYEIAKQKLEVSVSENLVLPQLDATGSYSRNQTDGSFAKVIQPDGHEWSLGLAFSIPIGNVAAESRLKKAKIDYDRLRRQRLEQVRAIELEVRTAVINLEDSLARRKAQQVVLKEARELEKVAKSRFSRGLATNLDITDAQIDIRDAETELLSATVDYNIFLAQLEAAIASPI